MLGGVCNSAANGMLQGFNMSGIANSAQQLSYKFRYLPTGRQVSLIRHFVIYFSSG